MKINFNRPLLRFAKDQPLLKPNSAEPFCLKDATIEALLAPEDNPRENTPAEEKVKRYLLATRIYADPEGIDLTVEEIAKIKGLIGKSYGPLIVAQAWEMLEGH